MSIWRLLSVSAVSLGLLALGIRTAGADGVGVIPFNLEFGGALRGGEGLAANLRRL